MPCVRVLLCRVLCDECHDSPNGEMEEPRRVGEEGRGKGGTQPVRRAGDARRTRHCSAAPGAATR